jgi:LemA protein
VVSAPAGDGRSYPDLKASASYIELQRRITGLEEQIAHRREYYNAAVNLNNVRLEQFPDALLVHAQDSFPARCLQHCRTSGWT